MKKTYFIILFTLFAFMATQAQSLQKSIGKATQLTDLMQNQASQTKAVTDFSDGFESYSNFALTFSPWTLVDVDGSETYGITDVDWTNIYAPQAFMVFNPSATTPAQTDADIQAHTGSKYAACFAATAPPNNDWLISSPLTAGTNTSVSFWVKSYTADYGLERYKVGVSTTNTDPSSFTIISGSSYLEAPVTWQQKTFDLNAYNGQTIYIGIQCVSNDAFIFMVDDFEFTTTVSEQNTLTGMVSDAFNGEPVAGATVEIAGMSTTTDSEGNYTITNIPAGTLNADFNADITQGDAPLSVNFSDQSSEGAQTVTCSKTGYITYINNQVVIEPGQTLNLNISLSQTLLEGSMRFVLNWGESPSDIDSHLNTPSIEGQTYHIYYNSQGNATSAPYAALDHDVTSGYGPETMTIYEMFEGTYQYYIYNYSGSPEITTSQAVLQIYNDNGLMQTLQIPTTGTGRYWNVCDINGSNGQLTIHNVIQEDAPGKFQEIYPEKAPSPFVLNSKNITSWLWNFGDGSTSTQQSPNHVYTAAGTYNVSLTVGDGINSNTETKNGFITVNGTGGTSTLTGMVSNALNGDPVEGALVSVAGLSTTTDAQGNYTINNVPAGALVANFNADNTAGTAPLAIYFTDQSTENSNTVTCSKTEFITYDNNQVVIPIGGSLTLNISLSPILAAGNMRFVLNWGAEPYDIDSHLNTPDIEGQAYHIYYADKGSATAAPYALLDYDITSGYGPETMTIYQMFNGTYQYYIYNFSGSPEITTSQAVVQIYDENGLVRTLQVPTTGEGLYWYVCDINGSNGALTIRNVIQQDAPGSFKDAMPEKVISPFTNDKNITSWLWNFGDGSSSELQNPSHTYNNDGSYSVSLTVSNGITQATETKTDFIRVGPIGVDENQLDEKVVVFPNPVDDMLQVQSEVPIQLLRITDLSGREVYRTDAKQLKYQVNVSQLNGGVYLLLIDTAEGKAVKKFTVK